MKSISKKQFENAVKKVLNGGKSLVINTREVKPFSWSRSKGHMNLRGSIPENSKFLRNDGRGGKASEVYLICELALGYEIKPTKTEQRKIDKINAKKANDRKKKANEKAKQLKEIALKNGYKSVIALKIAQKEIDKYNSERFERAIQERISRFEKQNNKSFQEYKISDRAKISHMELIFDCEYKNNLYN